MPDAEASAQPPRKSPRWGLRIGLIVGAVVTLCCGAGALLAWRMLAETGSARAVADASVLAVIDGDEEAALGHVCVAENSATSHEDFSARVRNENVTSERIVGTSISIRNFSLDATVRVELVGDRGPIETATLPMSKQDGEWKICSN